MRLSPPKKVTWWIAVVAGVIGFLGFFIPALSGVYFWLLAIGFALLAVATVVDGL